MHLFDFTIEIAYRSFTHIFNNSDYEIPRNVICEAS
jgi:hypothetical protein